MPSIASGTNKAIVAYVPALHAGYRAFFNMHPDASIFVLGTSFLAAFPRLNRDIRALTPEESVLAISALGRNVSVLDTVEALEGIETIILPDEDVSRDFAAKHLSGKNTVFENLFLRWDMQAANAETIVAPDRVISTDELDREFMRQATVEAGKSADWWRQIGGVLVKDGKALLKGHIRYFPSDLALDIFGTPRSNVDAGERPDLYISMHAEADLIAQAAKAGIATEGAKLYTTTFPCINCAFTIARAGIGTLYYESGYSRLDGEAVLKSAGVSIVLVKDA